MRDDMVNTLRSSAPLGGDIDSAGTLRPDGTSLDSGSTWLAATLGRLLKLSRLILTPLWKSHLKYLGLSGKPQAPVRLGSTLWVKPDLLGPREIKQKKLLSLLLLGK